MLGQALAVLVPHRKIDCVIVNAENAAGGSGITPPIFEKIIQSGVDLVTLGDHIYRRREIIPLLEKTEKMVRPANLPAAAPGKIYAICQTNAGHRVAVISLLGRLFMKMPTNCPFATLDQVLASLPRDIRVIVVDMHAEATSEKVALGWHADGRVSVLFGTHTHVPTADERILPKGTAYVTDVGMTGPYDSVLGRAKEKVISAMITGVPTPFDVAADDVRLSGVLVTVDAATGRATQIERIVHNGTSGA